MDDGRRPAVIIIAAMTDPAQYAYLPSQVRALDQLAIGEAGIPGYTLMSRAGEAAVAAIGHRWPGARRWRIVCGAGNNAGDGYVVARLARQSGLDVAVAALLEPSQLRGDAATAWQDYRRAGGSVTGFTGDFLADADVAVDALLGTGLTRPLEGAWLHAVEALNGVHCPVVALDLPTGLDGGTGEVLGGAVRADLTVTFVGLKAGCYLGAGPDHTGELVLADLAIPAEIRARGVPVMRHFTAADLARVLPRRARTAHKGHFGHVLVVGGNRGMQGAARLAGEAALRSGAGLVSVATRPDNAALISAVRPELMAHGVESPADLAPLLARATVVAVGPGLGQDDWARGLLGAVLAAPHPKVVDADALNLLATAPWQRSAWILTPHPGEAARLLGGARINDRRLEAVQELAHRYGGTVVLKGCRSLVAEDGGLPWLIDRGNPGMATAGMGDILTGITAALVAQTGAATDEVAAAAAWVHAAAGDAAARAGERGLIAGDVLAQLRPWLNPLP